MKIKENFSLFPVVLVLTAFLAATGWLVDSVYARELPFMRIKSQVIDAILLLVVVPIGFVLYYLIRKKNVWAKLFAVGLLVYLLFFIGFNTFNLHFNRLFLLYILVISISSFVLMREIQDLIGSVGRLEKLPRRCLISIVILFIALSGFGFWLSEVVPALISDTIPQSIQESKVPVNAACVFDLAFMLPIMTIGAIKLWKKEVMGLVISLVMLSWLVLTSISVVGMEIGLKLAGLVFDPGKMISVGFNGTLGVILIWIIRRKAEFTMKI
jgi:hypothetical protein